MGDVGWSVAEVEGAVLELCKSPFTGSARGAISLGPEPRLTERGLRDSGDVVGMGRESHERVLSPRRSSKVGMAIGLGALNFLVGVDATEFALIDFRWLS